MLGAALPPPIARVRPALTRPPDFTSFWRTTVAELDRQDPLIAVKRVDTLAGGLVLHHVTFASLGGARIGGYLLHGPADVRRPVIVHAHGYGDCCSVMTGWAAAGFAVFGVDVRGFGRSAGALPDRSPYGWIVTGLGRPETSALRGAVCDVIRGAEVALQLLGPAAGPMVRAGTSMAGGLAVMAEAVRPRAELLAVAVPSFGWMEGRRLLVRAGSGYEVNGYLRRLDPDLEEDVMVVLRYFDTMNFADLVRAPTIGGLGRADDVVPAPTVLAVLNHLAVPHEVWQLPVSHSTAPEEALWERFEARWLELGLGLA